MNVFEEMILIKNKKIKKFEDKTNDISGINYVRNQFAVTYSRSNKTYNYNHRNVRVFRNPKCINTEHIIVYIEEFPLRDPEYILDFAEYIRVIDHNQKSTTYHKSKVTYEKSCLNSQNTRDVFEYFKKLSAHVGVTDDGTQVLLNQYKKINKVNKKSILSTYMSGSSIEEKKNTQVPIFPFGLNVSQKKAVETALEKPISIIEGPPGTGKTQTILNIIANVISKGKTVGVVSGNNSATSNVQEKLDKNGYGFITALLGNSTNKKDFFEDNQQDIPDISGWQYDKEEIDNLYDEFNNTADSLNKLLEDKNVIAKLKEELSKLKVERTYFEDNFNEEYIPTANYSFYKKWSSDSILDFITQLEKNNLTVDNNKIIKKANLLFRYGVYKFKFIDNNQKNIIYSLKKQYYEKSIEERKKGISSIETRLKSRNYKKLMEQYTNLSSKLFKANLYKKYSKKSRGKYTVKNFKHKFQNFIEDYPVILSTTHSIRSSISENYLFDYLIIDEASQVDLVTASLAISCCKNVVIVGDVKQLPQIVSKEIKKISDEIFYANNLGEAYNYSKYSIIASLMKMYGEDLPKTLLSEHYRCHPKIIGFCNEKFYDNQLVIMTEENQGDIPLKIYKTAPGNHARKMKIGSKKGWYNLRQIEVVEDEIIEGQKHKYKDCSQVGIISPYRRHVIEAKGRIKKEKIEIDTVHKFQGREKDTIIFTTVANEINPFIDDANLINVAVSRAVKEFIVVTSDKLFKQHGTNIGDLIRYIEYNSLQSSVVESKKVSVFDLLYSEYSDKLLKFIKSGKIISKYNSENLMYGVIREVLAYKQFQSFKCVIYIPLYSIVKDVGSLNTEERVFVENPWTHVDFLIYNKLDKEPVLVIEVDGHKYHKNSEKQRKRDKLKDKILERINLPILRIVTNESGEKEKLINMLDKVVELSGVD